MKQPKLKKTIDKLAERVDANAATLEGLQSMLHGVLTQMQQAQPMQPVQPAVHPQQPPMPQVLPDGRVVFPNQHPAGAPQQVMVPPPTVVEYDDDGQEILPPSRDELDDIHDLPEEMEVDIDADDDRPKLDIVMPLQEGRVIPSQVLESMTSQGYNVKLWTSTLHSNGDIAAARNQVKAYSTTDYVLMHDNDIILPEGIIARMQDFLERHDDFGAVAVSKKHTPDPELGEVEVVGHVDAGPVLWRRELLHRLKYRYAGLCECVEMCRDLRAMGYEIGFLTGVIAQHVQETRSPLIKG